MVGASISGVEPNSAKLSHHLYCKGAWKQGKTRAKPMIKLNTKVDLEGYDNLRVRRPRVLSTSVRMNYMTDTGASISVAGMGFARQLGIREDDLLQTSMAVTSADGSSITVLGVVVVELQSEGVNTKEFVYICRGKRKH